MAVYTNINRGEKQKRTSRARSFPEKTWGIILLVIASIGSLALFTNFLTFLRVFLLGMFGVFSYAIFSSLFILARKLIMGKKYNINKKYALYFLLALISFLSILQMAFLGAGTATTFFEYLGDVYALQTSVGGVSIAIITYPLLKLLNPIGAYVFYIIILTIMSGFIVNYMVDNNTFKKPERKYVNFNKLKEATEPSSKAFFEEPKEKKQWFHKKPKTTLSLNTYEEKPNYNMFDSIVNGEETEQTALEQPVNEFKKEPFPALFEEPRSARPPKILHNDYSELKTSYSRPKSLEDEEARRKNLEFLHSTIPNRNKNQAEIKGTNVQNPNAQFSTTFLNQKISERLENYKKEKGVEDVDAKFEEDLLKAQTLMEKRKEEPVAEQTSNKTTSINDIFYKKEEEPFKERKKQEFQQIEINETKQVKEVNPKYKKPSRYVRPTLDLLNTISTNLEDYGDEYLEKSHRLERVLNDFKVPAKVIAVTRGPAVTRYELQMPAGVSVKKITQHAEDIAMTLASNGAVRIEAPIPGKNAVGVEVPNNKIATIALKDIIDSREFVKNKSNLAFGLGKDIAGNAKVCDLAKMPHLLVAGATGSGKSVCLNSLIVSLLYKSSPEDLRLILIDPKRVEFYVYNGLPHLMLPNVITEADKALNAFNWAIEEMERRFEVFQSSHVKNLAEYNQLLAVVDGLKPKMPLIVIIVDELADLMLTSKRDVEDKIMRLAAKARAAGIHLVLATQRPSVDVITGTIKANLPSRIAFSVTSIADSKTILDGGGADKLLGKGDMLYAPIDYPEPRRIQGAFVSNEEVHAIVEFIKNNNKAYFDDSAAEFINKKVSSGMVNSEVEIDPMLPQALKLCIESGQASTSMLQRKFAIGYSRAARIVDQMEELKYISAQDGSKPRNVYMTMDRFIKIYGED